MSILMVTPSRLKSVDAMGYLYLPLEIGLTSGGRWWRLQAEGERPPT